ncbi:MAG: F0F1 ATP synthase subunit B [Actinomycetota bacterium]|nr:F0F1 ATP synthase subunit B [Actinomycetota bacterium]
MPLGIVGPVTILAAQSGMSVVLPEPAELIWGAVGFGMLFALMQWKVFPALNGILAERQAKIQGRLEEAESARSEAEELRRMYRELLADARDEASTIVEEAKSDGQRRRDDIIAQAEQDASEILERAREDAEAERGRMVQDLRAQFAALSVDLAEAIVQRELDEEAHRDLVDQYISELAEM